MAAAALRGAGSREDRRRGRHWLLHHREDQALRPRGRGSLCARAPHGGCRRRPIPHRMLPL
jgi:hypothetical protein